MSGSSAGEEFGHLLVERSGGIGGFLLVWDLNIDQSAQRETLGERVADLPWPYKDEDGGGDGPIGETPAPAAPQSAVGAGGGADRYVYLIESRFGYARFGETELTGEWKDLVDHVREIAEPERRRPGAN